jgi:hypothetical protein
MIFYIYKSIYDKQFVMNSFLPDSNFNIRVTKFDMINGLIKDNKVKFEIIPKPLKIKTIYKINQDQAQLISFYILSKK